MKEVKGTGAGVVVQAGRLQRIRLMRAVRASLGGVRVQGQGQCASSFRLRPVPPTMVTS